MHKVRIFNSYNERDLENRVNEFIATHCTISIQFQVGGAAPTRYFAMILYEEKDTGDV